MMSNDTHYLVQIQEEEAMKDKPEVGRGKKKKLYARPEVKKITLTPEEAVLGFCKNSSKNGPVNPSNCGTGVYCYGLGS